ncbi:MAG: D-amino-acid transaminase [Alphaproteobacteria bacterium]|nr:D-amino-acid transaminase [Alphaproteobacteria bacterium]MDE2112346.1 D-amino-acid transaminase [Alphaproteobacteria bacterium]MDE2492804.1 D-amino-acid transaminase [Alphaproteobacteria bacterium]
MDHWNGRRPAGRIAYVNGRYVPHGEAGVHVEDRGLQLGDAVYEVCRIENGHMLDLEEHLDRLERSLREIEMAMPMRREALKLVMAETVRRNHVRDGLLYLQVTRGALKRDHPIPEHPPKPTLIMTARAMDEAALVRRHIDGVAVLTCPDRRWGRCDIKTTQLLANLLAKTAARRAGALEAWMIDDDGFVTEGASTNAWIVDGEGRVVTRDLSHAILPGVTRRVILEAAAAAQIPVVERRFTLAEALAAREAFLSSATGAAIPVVSIDGKKIGTGSPGPLTRRIAELYAKRSRERLA